MRGVRFRPVSVGCSPSAIDSRRLVFSLLSDPPPAAASPLGLQSPWPLEVLPLLSGVLSRILANVLSSPYGHAGHGLATETVRSASLSGSPLPARGHCILLSKGGGVFAVRYSDLSIHFQRGEPPQRPRRDDKYAWQMISLQILGLVLDRR